MLKKIVYYLTLISSLSFAQHDSSIVFLGDIDSTIVTEVRYATTNNFTGKVLYPTDKVYIRKIVGEALSGAHNYLLENYNLRIKIFDAFRPLSVQKQMWAIYPDPNYVADPSKGSRHNRGAAVDITIIDSSGAEINMGTEYDNFTEKAHYDYEDLPEPVKDNRKLLHDIMVKFGFIPLETEWWHFDYKDWRNYSIIDYKLN
jgi:D-alanyl-D-alanine dipeptidase